MQNLKRHIFRKYDIRGIYKEDLDENVSNLIGKALGSEFNKLGIKTISVGMDGRLSSESLKKSLILGLNYQGINVIDVGVIPTPTLYFSVYHLNLDAGVMITGSHNPKDYNGFKIMLKDRPFFDQDLINLYNLIISDSFTESNQFGTLETFDINSFYISKVTQRLKNLGFDKYNNIAIDCGNGVAGILIKDIAKTLNIPIENLLYCDVDGTFPNHHPDPTVEKNMTDLKSLVIKNNCLFGVGYDGDADRVGVVDKNGRFLYGDQIMSILSKYILKEIPGSTIISDVKASKFLFDLIDKNGGKSIMWQTGHSFIKKKMKESGAILAGEMSGHIFYKDDYYGYDDGIYSSLRLLEIVLKYSTDIALEIDLLPKTFSTPEVKLKVDEILKFDIIQKVINFAKLKYNNYCDIDGIRVDTIDGWWLIRASNTENNLIIRCESDSRTGLDRLKSEVRDVLNFVGIDEVDL